MCSTSQGQPTGRSTKSKSTESGRSLWTGFVREDRRCRSTRVECGSNRPQAPKLHIFGVAERNDLSHCCLTTRCLALPLTSLQTRNLSVEPVVCYLRLVKLAVVRDMVNLLVDVHRSSRSFSGLPTGSWRGQTPKETGHTRAAGSASMIDPCNNSLAEHTGYRWLPRDGGGCC